MRMWRSWSACLRPGAGGALSLYLAVPLDPAGVRGLAAEAAELMASAVGLAGRCAR